MGGCDPKASSSPILIIAWRKRQYRVLLPKTKLTAPHRFFRQLRFQEFDVSELSLSSYVLTLSQEPPPFIAIPVFPSRFFRHQSMYINVNSGIKKPSDLKGKRIGIPEYQS
jgi:ABC-type amino acid transport substrate-binding protein